jgi:hypothetical protein
MGKEVKAQRGLRSGKGTSVIYGYFAPFGQLEITNRNNSSILFVLN